DTVCAPASVNSSGVAAELTVRGSSAVADNQVELFVRNLPEEIVGYFLTSRTYGAAVTPAGSVGTLCLDGVIGHYVGPSQIKGSGSSGTFGLFVDLTQTPQGSAVVQVAPGDSWTFQAWYRDEVAAQPTSNFTSGVELSFR
ncbi:MAG: hypothetical protein AAGG01_14815, partial [Planctomycetota bacterium]